MAVDTTVIAATIKKDVAQLVAGINAHDAVKATEYDAPNIVCMEWGSPSTIGVEADREGFRLGFARTGAWKVNLIVYRGTYNEDSQYCRRADDP